MTSRTAGYPYRQASPACCTVRPAGRSSSVQTGYEGQGDEDGRDHGEDLHDLVHPVRHRRHVLVDQAGGHFERLHHVHELDSVVIVAQVRPCSPGSGTFPSSSFIASRAATARGRRAAAPSPCGSRGISREGEAISLSNSSTSSPSFSRVGKKESITESQRAYAKNPRPSYGSTLRLAQTLPYGIEGVSDALLEGHQDPVAQEDAHLLRRLRKSYFPQYYQEMSLVPLDLGPLGTFKHVFRPRESRTAPTARTTPGSDSPQMSSHRTPLSGTESERSPGGQCALETCRVIPEEVDSNGLPVRLGMGRECPRRSPRRCHRFLASAPSASLPAPCFNPTLYQTAKRRNGSIQAHSRMAIPELRPLPGA